MYIQDQSIKTIAAAKTRAAELSVEHAGQYVIVVNDFGAAFIVTQRLHVFAPSDAMISSYFLNGKEKQFTSAKKRADQLATPLSQ